MEPVMKEKNEPYVHSSHSEFLDSVFFLPLRSLYSARGNYILKCNKLSRNKGVMYAR